MSSGEQEALRLATRARRIEKVLSANETVPTNSVIEFMIDADNELRRLLAEREADRAAMRAALAALKTATELPANAWGQEDFDSFDAAISSLKARTQ